MDAIHRALDAGTDPRVLARQVVDYLRALLFVQMGNESQVELPADVRAQAKRHAKAFRSAEVLRMIRLFNAAAVDQRGSWQPALSLEVALAEALEAPAAVPPSPAGPAKETPPTRRTDQPHVGEGRPASSGKSAPSGGKPAGAAKAADHAAGEETPVAAAGTGGESPVSLDQIVKVWKQVCAAIKPQNPSLNGLLNSARLLEIKDGVLLLGFASDLVRSKADTPEQMQITRQALAELIGVDLPVRCVISNAKKSAPPDVKQNGMVAAALKKGGEIVDIQ
jgi:DNA polymerase-3 subunit gamma/tau